MSLNEAIAKYKKYKNLSKIDEKHIHVHNYKMDKYATILQKGGYDVKRLDKIDTVVTKIDNIMNNVQNGRSRTIDLSGGANKGHGGPTNANGNESRDNTLSASNNSKIKKTVVKIDGIDLLQSAKGLADQYNASIDAIYRDLQL